LKHCFIFDTILNMKREIKETKKSPDTKRKTKISEVVALPKKDKIIKGKPNAALEIKAKAKKSGAKNLTLKPAAKKDVVSSAKIVKPIAKKKTTTDKAKTEKQSSPVKIQKNKTQASKVFLKPTDKTEGKNKPTVVKEKITKPKSEKKLVTEAEDKKSKSVKKAAIIKQAVEKKIQAKPAAETGKSKTKKPAPVVFVQSKASKAKKNLSGVVKNAKALSQKKPLVVESKKKPKTQKTEPVISVQKSKSLAQISAPKTQKKTVENLKTGKTETKKIKAAVPVQKANSQANESVSVKKVKAPEQTVITEKAPLPKKPVNKKAKPISSAVLRGKKGRYDFEVFPLDANFEAVSAIYVITKRITDKRKRGHHKLVCIGQTESIVDGIKMHKKDKCIKQNEANVICLLKEESEKNRLKIADDLREAHSISCNRQ